MMTLLSELYQEGEQELTYSPEGLEVLKAEDTEEMSVYVLLTDTKTQFSRISRFITTDPYNHVSLMLEESFDSPIYTFALNNYRNGYRGGFMIEDRKDLKGSLFSLYKLNVTTEIYQKIKERVEGYANNPESTSYNHLGLFNAIFRKNIFSNKDAQAGICSEFVVEVLKFSGVNLFKSIVSSTVRPYDLIKSKLLKFVRRGKIE